MSNLISLPGFKFQFVMDVCIHHCVVGLLWAYCLLTIKRDDNETEVRTHRMLGLCRSPILWPDNEDGGKVAILFWLKPGTEISIKMDIIEGRVIFSLLA